MFVRSIVCSFNENNITCLSVIQSRWYTNGPCVRYTLVHTYTPGIYEYMNKQVTRVVGIEPVVSSNYHKFEDNTLTQSSFYHSWSYLSSVLTCIILTLRKCHFFFLTNHTRWFLSRWRQKSSNGSLLYWFWLTIDPMYRNWISNEEIYFTNSFFAKAGGLFYKDKYIALIFCSHWSRFNSVTFTGRPSQKNNV